MSTNIKRTTKKKTTKILISETHTDNIAEIQLDNVASTETLEATALQNTGKTCPSFDKEKSVEEVVTKKKMKTKKTKKSETDKQNISMKSSFRKFDALQNIIHNPQVEENVNCRICAKPVYKMEEIKAEKSLFHKTCFRCKECNKQLKVDNYQSHEGELYCIIHFKLLFHPKCAEDTEPEKPRKPELIIRENQPAELPPDVIRASDKPDLGLEDLQQLNVRSRFQVFENSAKQTTEENIKQNFENVAVKRSTSIVSKLAKLQARGVTTGISNPPSFDVDDDNESDVDDSDDPDAELVNSKKTTQRERPVGLGNAMEDIKIKFEKGHSISKDERREERKQEIQNIRSRLFMGKQARIKEMYQQAVAESEQAITSSQKKMDIEIDGTARSLMERFENGDIFHEARSDDENRTVSVHDEADVFESAISKKSRSIFLELDANAVAGKYEDHKKTICKTQSFDKQRNQHIPSISNKSEQDPDAADVVKYDEKVEDIKIATSEVSSKFKFFETYRPTEYQKKEFRITPPREGVVKMPTPESENDLEHSETTNDTKTLEKSQTTSKILNKFREMEHDKQNSSINAGPKPLKCFTPPPEGERHLSDDQDSDSGSQEDEEEADEVMTRANLNECDEALKEAQAAARAKQLRAKFEKWEANEIQREFNEGRVDIYSQQVSDDSNIESTKTIRQRFENMKNFQKTASAKPRHQVNRFV